MRRGLRFDVSDRNIWGANQTSTSIDYSLTSSQWNLAGSENSDNYGPKLGSVAKDRDFIRSELMRYLGNAQLNAAY